jgi:succinyl-diaminopimelate desuccinylase
VLDERLLAERLICYDTSRPEELVAAAGFVKGWLESRGIEVREVQHNGLPVLLADVGPPPESGVPSVILHGHLDVVPAHEEQFQPRLEGDRLYGRGAYDMKGGLAAMMCALKDVESQDGVSVRFLCVPDEESEELDRRSIDALLAGGLRGSFAITGEPTDLHIGVEAKGVLAMRIEVQGRSSHSSTPWLGENAVLKAIDVFRTIESLPFSRESSDMFDRPSINLGRIQGGDAVNKVPDQCTMVVDIRYLPGQDPEEILAAVREMPEVEVTRTFIHPPVRVSRTDVHVLALRDSLKRSISGEAMSVGREGASDAAAFLAVGIPAVEFGPQGGGHHGPDEWVSVSSLARYRRALGEFVRALPGHLEQAASEGAATTADEQGGGEAGLRAIRGGRS